MLCSGSNFLQSKAAAGMQCITHKWQNPLIILALYSMSAAISMRR